ncbi:transcriptional regulator, TetR family [Sanguibacter gelidistatuariae]|uniref:Transcriptional regulator, TetR family n=1 Tax=Sanguibacter gelidistatuariae TaxID=1814289 RepID=A0A1G6H684_9MICO|nr:TetR/AcrR family transcriptional regulator [Sanguibacter gelidistatuariae]SDB89663.1 transcriptional regulator, TetR family [Sanguibacter gelidistatuariae]
METTGLRERKKARTRQALADAALKLFLQRGYDGVTVAQIADAAEVSLATLFKHVPDGKEALIFDDGTERRDALVEAVRDRPDGTPVLEALHAYMAGRGPFAGDLPADLQGKRELIVATPALRGYQRRLWVASEDALAAAIAAEANQEAPGAATRALARYVLEIPDIAGMDPNPRESLDAIFDLLTSGWSAL